MPGIKKKVKPAPQSGQSAPPTGGNDKDFRDEVMTLREAAVYLRLSEADVRRLVEEQGLPARQLGEEWRFLKCAIQAWLSTPHTQKSKKDIWSAAGSWKNDPYLDEMLKAMERMRGRPGAEE